MQTDPHNLQRFLDAQFPLYEEACKELRNGKKLTHWMWFIFPQIEGLGRTSTAKLYAIKSLNEAKAYINHPTLGPRLSECTDLVNAIENKSINRILGSPDDLKFRSCMTLFTLATEDNKIFRQALDKYYNGEQDVLTWEKVGANPL